MSFVQRLISCTFTKAVGTFAEGGNTATVSGLRISCQVVNGGTQAMTAHLRIYGMTLSLMNQLSTLCQAIGGIQANSISINAGDSSQAGSLPLMFTGTIQQAWVDFQSAPQVAFDVSATTTLAPAAFSAKPLSYSAPVTVQTIMQALASEMGLTFENNGVNITLPAPSYFPGTQWEQAKKAALDANVNIVIDRGKLAIWPRDGARTTLGVPIISKATGMIMSPTYANQGLIIRTEFNPAISFGGQIQVQSQHSTPANGAPVSNWPANGIWSVYSLNHDLETLTPRGQWFSTIEAYNPAFPKPAAVAP